MDIVSIYYDYNANVFEDEDDNNYDISSIISDKELAEFKEIGGVYYYDHPEFGIRYEVVFPINDPNRTLYYDEDRNIIYDECGDIMYNMFSLITPNDLYLFKKNKKTVEILGVTGGIIELVWLE